MTVLLTGSSGYLGQAIFNSLKQKGINVVRLGSQSRHPEIEIDWDLQAQDFQLPKAECLIHCAWNLRVSQLDEAIELNVTGSKRLFDKFLQQNPDGRIIFISSASAVPGNKTVYGQTKLMVEAYLKNNFQIFRPGLLIGDGPVKGIVGTLQKLSLVLPILPFPYISKQNLFFCKINAVECVVIDSVLQARNFPKILYIGERNFYSLKQILEKIKGTKKLPVLLPVPWPIVYWALRIIEKMGFNFRLRSDGLQSLLFLPEEKDLGETPWLSG